MAKPVKSRVDAQQEALQKLEQPQVKWKVIAQIAGAFVILWVVALMTTPTIGYWGVGVVGGLTLAAIGFGIYIWRMTSKSKQIIDVLKMATDDAGRRAALEKLAEKGGDDAMNALARAQLLAQEDPAQAIAVLEAVDLKKTSGLLQDDVRANLGLLYLMTNRVRDARPLADEIRLDRAPQAKSKAMYAAVMAESFARTGKADEAKKLLETYRAEDPEFGEVRPLLLRASVFTFTATKNRGLARKAMEQMAAIEPNALGAFLHASAGVELQKMARELLSASGVIPRQKMQIKMR